MASDLSNSIEDESTSTTTTTNSSHESATELERLNGGAALTVENSGGQQQSPTLTQQDANQLPREAMESIAIDESSSFIISSDDDVDKETAAPVGGGVQYDNSSGCKILNDVHLIRNRYASTNQRIKRQIELMSEDKVSRLKLEEVHSSLPSSNKSTFIMTFSPDGRRVASTHGDHRIYICDLNTGKLLDTLEGHPKTPWCLAWHPINTDILASGCLAGEVRVWDLKTKACESWTNSTSNNNNHNNNIITSLDFHPKERILVIATNNTVNFWDWGKSEPFARVETSHQRENVKFVVFDSTGTKLITGINNLPKFVSCNSESFQSRIIDNFITHGNGLGNGNGNRNETIDQPSPPTEYMTQQSSETTTSQSSGRSISNDTDINQRNTTNISKQQSPTSSVQSEVEPQQQQKENANVNASAGTSSNRSPLIDETLIPSTSQAKVESPILYTSASTSTSLASSKRKGSNRDDKIPASKRKKIDRSSRTGNSNSKQTVDEMASGSNVGLDGQTATSVQPLLMQQQSSGTGPIGTMQTVNDPITGQPIGMSHHTVLLNQFGGSNSNVTLAMQDPASPERFVVWNNGTQSVEQSLQRIISAAAANLQHTILVKIYHRSQNGSPGVNGNSNNTPPSGSPIDISPSTGQPNDRPTFESRRRALSQDLSASGAVASTSGGSGASSPPSGLPAWLSASLTTNTANPSQQQSNPEPPSSRVVGAGRPTLHGLLPGQQSSSNRTSGASVNNSTTGGGSGGGSSGLNNNGNINYETWQRHPHVHVYQTRGSGPHLWFNHWTIPLPANQSNYRLQCWNFSLTSIPDIKDPNSNLVTKRCRIHNASSVDVSSDGNLLACLVPRDETNISSFDLKLFSLRAKDLGVCLYRTHYGPNAISVSLSPSANYIVVGLKSPRFISNNPTDDDLTIAKVFKLSDDIYTNNGRPISNDGDEFGVNQDDSSKHSQTTDNVNNNGNIRYIREIKIKRLGSSLNLNAIKWMPRGIVYNVGPQHHQRNQATRIGRERRVVT